MYYTLKHQYMYVRVTFLEQLHVLPTLFKCVQWTICFSTLDGISVRFCSSLVVPHVMESFCSVLLSTDAVFSSCNVWSHANSNQHYSAPAELRCSPTPLQVCLSRSPRGDSAVMVPLLCPTLPFSPTTSPQPQQVFSGSLRTGLEKGWSWMKKERWKAEKIFPDYSSHVLVRMHKSFRCHPCVDGFQIYMPSWDFSILLHTLSTWRFFLDT